MEDRLAFPDKRMKFTVENARSHRTSVYIWDMDETLILLKSLLNGTFAEAYSGSKDKQKGIEIGQMWEKLILGICDDFFFYEQIEDYNAPFVGAFSKYDDGMDISNYDFRQDGFNSLKDESGKRKMAYRLRAIANTYNKGLQNIFDHQTKDHWDELYQITDKYTDEWLSSARCFLQQCSSVEAGPIPSFDYANQSADNEVDPVYQCINVVVTSGFLVPSLAKCLLFRFDSLIEHGNVYSSWDVGKFQCFEWIKKQFDGPNVQFCVLGDGSEECEAAEKMKWPFVKIDMQPGSSYRFPGLTLKTVGYYFSVVYGNRNDIKDEEETGTSALTVTSD